MELVKGKKIYISSLTSLRGIAAIIVVMYHLEPKLRDVVDYQTPFPFIADGQLMVDFFFILSGFILAHAYAPDRARAGSWLDVRKFFARRFARVYPMHAFMLVVFLAYEIVDVLVHRVMLGQPDRLWFEGGTSIGSYFTNILLIQAWGIHDTLTWNQPSWSISAEFAAYLAFPILVWVFSIRNSAVVAAIAAVLAFASLVAIQEANGRLTASNGYAVFNCLAEFTIGIVLYYWISLDKLCGQRGIAFIQLAVFAAIVIFISAGASDIFVVPLFALLTVACRSDRGWLGKVLSRPFFLWLGRISYSLYISHYIFIRLFDAPWESILPSADLDGRMSQGLLLALEFSLIVSFAHICFVMIENPARRRLGMFAR